MVKERNFIQRVGDRFANFGRNFVAFFCKIGRGFKHLFTHPIDSMKIFGRAFIKVHWGSQIILFVFSLLVIIPLLWVLIQSFKSRADFASGGFTSFPSAFNFDNYIKAWNESSIGTYFLNSIIMTALPLAMSLIMCVPCAYVLTRFKFWGSKIIFVIIMAGIFINVNYIVRPIYILISSIGKGLGIKGFTNNQFIVALVNATNSCSFGIYLLSGFFKTLPKDYEEAAMIDGCGYFRTMIKVMAPIALPSIISVMLFNFLAYWNEYLIARTFFTSPANYTIPIGLQISQNTFAKQNQYGRLFAGLVIAMLPVIILYCFVQSQLTKGIGAGGLKE